MSTGPPPPLQSPTGAGQLQLPPRPSAPYKPTEPKMGGIVQMGATEFVSWTGGKPSFEYKNGLADPQAKQNKQVLPSALRLNSASHQQKSFDTMSKDAVEPKLKKDDPKSREFGRTLTEKLVHYGLDTICYVKSETIPNEMEFIVEAHFRMTKEHVVQAMEEQRKEYDSYDHANDVAARKILRASVDPTLLSEVDVRVAKSGIESTITFPVLYKLIIGRVHTLTVASVDQLEKNLKDLHPSKFSGQNVDQLCTEARRVGREIEDIVSFDPKLTTFILKALADVRPKPDVYANKVTQLREQHDALLDETINIPVGPSKTARFKSANLDYVDICDMAEDHYGKAFKRGEWPAAQIAHPQKQTVPSSFGANLLQQTVRPAAPGGSEGVKGNCFNCGQPGHMKRDCPQPLKQQTPAGGRGPGGGRGRQQTGRGSSGGRHGGRGPNSGGRGDRIPQQGPTTSPKRIPPAPGEGESRNKPDGTREHWCARCNRWNTTHTTTEHRGSQGSTAALAAAFLDDVPPTAPAAWIASLDRSSYWWLTAVSPLGILQCIMIMCTAHFIWPYIMSISSIMCEMVRSPQAVSLSIWLWELTLSIRWGLIGPLLWVIILWMSVLTGRLSDDEDPTSNTFTSTKRAQAREQAKFDRRSRRRPKYKLASTSKLGYNRSYPIKYRSSNLYYDRKDSLRTQAYRQSLKQIAVLETRVSEVLRRLDRYRNENSSTSTKSQQAGATKVFHRPKTFSGHTTVQGQHRSMNCSSVPPCGPYQPVPTVPSPRNLNHGNMQRPSRRAAAVQKIVSHVLMASVVMPSNASQAWLATPSWSMFGATSPDTQLRVAMMSPSQFRQATPVQSRVPVIMDSGASINLTNDEKDFTSPMQRPSWSIRLQGIARGLSVTGVGETMYTFEDDLGGLRSFPMTAYYSAQATTRLVSLSTFLQCVRPETFTVEPHLMRLSGVQGDPTRRPVTIRVNPATNLPTAMVYRGPLDTFAGPAVAELNTCVTDAANQNLSEAEKELLRWHTRLGHLNFRAVQFLMKTGALCHSESKRSLHTAAAKVSCPPKCAACQFGKQTRRPSPSKTSSVVTDRVGALKTDNLLPGQRVSVDHFICSTKGRRLSTRGRDASTDPNAYTGGCIFVDHASKHIHVEHQAHLNTHETLQAKQAFEAMARDSGVIVQEYLSDNGSAFSSAKFSEQLSVFRQVLRFAGVGAHHHNGVAERAISTVMSMSRTMMLHAAIHWPEVADAALWPMAVQHAVYIYNHVPDPSTGLCPSDIFTRSRWPQKRLHDIHVWGCPLYVLDKSLADGRKIPRWQPRSRRSVYVGGSPAHASSVPLALNTDTGFISPQFHVVFDDWFATVSSSADIMPDLGSPTWQQLFHDSQYQYIFDDADLLDQAAAAADDAADAAAATSREEAVARAMDATVPPQPLPHLAPSSSQTAREEVPHSPVVVAQQPPPFTLQREETSSAPMQQREITMNEALVPASSRAAATTAPAASPRMTQEHQTTTIPVTTSPALRRTTRVHRAPRRLIEEANQVTAIRLGLEGAAFAASTFDLPQVFVASRSDPDTLSFDQAMRESPVQVDRWREAAVSEIRSLEAKGTWTEVPKDSATSRILPGTWVFRRKRGPDGSIRKYKARYCVRGDLEETNTAFETHSPVVAWPTIRTMLVLCIVFEFKTTSIDFTNAFVQAAMPYPLWIQLPRGFRTMSTTTDSGTTCLQLNKSLYGISASPRLWYDHLTSALRKLGFLQSKHDPCLLFRSNMLIAIFVDDCCIGAKSRVDIDNFLKELKKADMEFTQEGTLEEFLGVKIDRDMREKTITLSQPGLTERIIRAAGMNDCNPNWTPASLTPLGSDPNGEPMEETWEYASIVGMISYLCTTSRPDIAFATSQVARHTHQPKKSHATAVKTIIRYLKGTVNCGIIMKPTGDMVLDCFVDADFAGLWKSEPDANPASAKSRMGYIFTLGGCPLIWKSKLLQEICLSTCEAEYSSLSLALRQLIPLRRVVQEMSEQLQLTLARTVTTYSTVFEDNNSALILATSQRLTSRTRYFAVKYHHFWSLVNNGEIRVVKVATGDQSADVLTKALPRITFEKLRLKIMGW